MSSAPPIFPTHTPGEMPIGALLRAEADGELTAAERPTLDRHLAAHPEDRGCIKFEMDLRAACGRVMSGGSVAAAPAGLRERIGRSIEEVPGAAVPATSDGARGRTRRLWPLLAAAVLVLAAAPLVYLVATGYFEPVGTPAGKAHLARFVCSEHNRCGRTEAALRAKATVYDLAGAPAAFQPLLGGTLSIGALEKAGFEFRGAGPCIVPGKGRSVHMLFRSPGVSIPENVAAPRDENLSVFVQTDTGELPVSPGVTYRLGDAAAGRPLVLVWSQGGLLYYLVTDNEGTQAIARMALKLPVPGGTL
jgi:hypothetical protein